MKKVIDYSISSAEEYKGFAASDDEHEFSKTLGTASEEVWMEILSKYPNLARHVAFNNSVSIEVLERAIEVGDVWTRFDIAMKRRISRKLFEKLSMDKDVSVRERIALNPKVPEDILSKLCMDEDFSVSEAAKERWLIKHP
jgi:hypothetical protein